MNIVVAGVGKAGHALVRQLDAEGHDVTVIESKSQVLEQTPDYLDVVGLQGSGTDVDVLREARAAKANLVIAATSTDETDIVICLLGRGLKEVMIAGGSRIAAYLATRLLDINIAVKIIEKNPDKALDLALRFPDVTVICRDGTDQATLLSENLDGMDGFVSLTDNDEENVIISMFAEQQGVEHVVPKVNRVELGFLLENRASPMP
ncbi:NAD-binding protein [Faecalibaculum rodentium]|uniref:NAD-binding protein n=2 Tax=Faecalibaculum rodentium TaxID=1702221 RepID=UPI00260C0468|nr:NAD-binding protein [Faecalibaculum rodentium]